jgi:hypothetical protein
VKILPIIVLNVMSRDVFLDSVKFIVNEKNIDLKFNRLSQLMERINSLDYNDYQYILESSIGSSFIRIRNEASNSISKILMKILLRNTDEDYFAASVILYYMVMGKIDSLKKIYSKNPELFKKLNIDRLFKEIQYNGIFFNRYSELIPYEAYISNE